ncbi:MAG: hypothetical protein Q9169_007833 [Polycauliona sp. 2 TL-2023]
MIEVCTVPSSWLFQDRKMATFYRATMFSDLVTTHEAGQVPMNSWQSSRSKDRLEQHPTNDFEAGGDGCNPTSRRTLYCLVGLDITLCSQSILTFATATTVSVMDLIWPDLGDPNESSSSTEEDIMGRSKPERHNKVAAEDAGWTWRPQMRELMI